MDDLISCFMYHFDWRVDEEKERREQEKERREQVKERREQEKELWEEEKACQDYFSRLVLQKANLSDEEFAKLRSLFDKFQGLKKRQDDPTKLKDYKSIRLVWKFLGCKSNCENLKV